MASGFGGFQPEGNNDSTRSWQPNMAYKAASFVFTCLRWLYEFIIKALEGVNYYILGYTGNFIVFINYLTICLTQQKRHYNRYLSKAIGKLEYNNTGKSLTLKNLLLNIYSGIVYLIVSAVQLIDTLIHIAVRLFKLPYDLIQKTLEFISKAITSVEMKQKKYSHFITKISLLTLTTFIYLQYSPKLSNNPISNYFKNLFKKLGIQLNKNALTASLISMTIFFVLFMFRTPVNFNNDWKKTTNPVNPLDKYQFTFFMMLSIAAGPIAYALNATLPASIVIGLAPFALALLMLVGNMVKGSTTISNQLKTLFPSAFGMIGITCENPNNRSLFQISSGAGKPLGKTN